jgi:hypothetical protein
LSEESIRTAGILLITVPAIALGGARLLRLIWGGQAAISTTPSARASGGLVTHMPGVLVILARLKPSGRAEPESLSA